MMLEKLCLWTWLGQGCPKLSICLKKKKKKTKYLQKKKMRYSCMLRIAFSKTLFLNSSDPPLLACASVNTEPDQFPKHLPNKSDVVMVTNQTQGLGFLTRS